MSIALITTFTFLSGIAAAKGPTPDKKLDALHKKVGAQAVAIERPEALAKTVAKLKKGAEPVRILQLGDSHIASDYITSRIRTDLQKRFGDGGRGFVQPDQRLKFGGRRLKRNKHWKQERIVDKGQEGKPFGFSGLVLRSKSKLANVSFQLQPADKVVRINYRSRPDGAAATVSLDGKVLGVIEAAGEIESKFQTFKIDLPDGGKRALKLKIAAESRNFELLGISFETGAPGVIYESIGPVGADAKVYLDLEINSFTESLKAHKPDLIVLMVGGNDALKARKKWRTLDDVRGHHEQLIDRLRTILPDAEIMLWSPMDAGKKRKGKVVSKPLLEQIRTLQEEVAAAKKVAYWDTLDAMGGPGSITRWTKARVMNKDLVHPKRAAADLLGRLFSAAFLSVVDS